MAGVKDLGPEPQFEESIKKMKKKKIKPAAALSNEVKPKSKTRKEITSDSKDLAPEKKPKSKAKKKKLENLTNNLSTEEQPKSCRNKKDDKEIPGILSAEEPQKSKRKRKRKRNEKGVENQGDEQQFIMINKKPRLLEKEDQKSEEQSKPGRQKFSYENILKKLRAITSEEEAVELIKQDIEKGELGEKDIGNVIRKWRQAKKRKDLPRPDLKELSAYEGTLSDLKDLVTGFVQNGLLHPMAAGRIVSKWKMREARRVRRQVNKKSSRICLKCRQPGHKINECPQMTNQEGVDICFKCGSTEHAIYKCPRKDKVQGFPYATCFICKQQGHLSKDCEKNDKGIYPDGGCCNICSSKFHLIKDCPQRLSSSGGTVGEDLERETIRGPRKLPRSVDEDNFDFEVDTKNAETLDEPREPPKRSKKEGQKKVVKF